MSVAAAPELQRADWVDEFIAHTQHEYYAGAGRRPRVEWENGELGSLGSLLEVLVYLSTYCGVRLPDWIVHAATPIPHGVTVAAPLVASSVTESVVTPQLVRAFDDRALPLVNRTIGPVRRAWTGEAMRPARIWMNRNVTDQSGDFFTDVRLRGASNVGHLVGGGLLGAGLAAVLGGSVPLLVGMNAAFRYGFPFLDNRLHAHDFFEDQLGKVMEVGGKGTRAFGRTRRKLLNLTRLLVGRDIKDYSEKAKRQLLKQFEIDPESLSPDFPEWKPGWYQRLRMTRCLRWADEIIGDAPVSERERKNLARLLLAFTLPPEETIAGEKPEGGLARLPKRLYWEIANFVNVLRPQQNTLPPMGMGVIHEAEGAYALGMGLAGVEKSILENSAIERVLGMASGSPIGDLALVEAGKAIFRGIAIDDIHRVLPLSVVESVDPSNLTADDRSYIARSLVRALHQLGHSSMTRLRSHVADETVGGMTLQLIDAAEMQSAVGEWSPTLDRLDDEHREKLLLTQKVLRDCETHAPRNGVPALQWSLGQKFGKGEAAFRVVQFTGEDARVRQRLTDLVEIAATFHEQAGSEKLAKQIRRDVGRQKVTRMASHLVNAVEKFGSEGFTAGRESEMTHTLTKLATLPEPPATDNVVFRVGGVLHDRSWALPDRAATADELASKLASDARGQMEVADALLAFVPSPARGLEPKVVGADKVLAHALSAAESPADRRNPKRLEVLADVLDPSVFERITERLASGRAQLPEDAPSLLATRRNADAIRSRDAARLTGFANLFGAEAAQAIPDDQRGRLEAQMADLRMTPGVGGARPRVGFRSFADVQQLAEILAENVDPSKFDSSLMRHRFTQEALIELAAAFTRNGTTFVDRRIQSKEGWHFTSTTERVTPATQRAVEIHTESVRAFIDSLRVPLPDEPEPDVRGSTPHGPQPDDLPIRSARRRPSAMPVYLRPAASTHATLGSTERESASAPPDFSDVFSIDDPSDIDAEYEKLLASGGNDRVLPSLAR